MPRWSTRPAALAWRGVYAVYFAAFYAFAMLMFAMRLPYVKKAYNVSYESYKLSLNIEGVSESIRKAADKLGALAEKRAGVEQARMQSVRDIQNLVRWNFASVLQSYGANEAAARNRVLRDPVCQPALMDIQRLTQELKPIQRKVDFFQKLKNNLDKKLSVLCETKDYYEMTGEISEITASLESAMALNFDEINSTIFEALNKLSAKLHESNDIDIEQQEMLKQTLVDMPGGVVLGSGDLSAGGRADGALGVDIPSDLLRLIFEVGGSNGGGSSSGSSANAESVSRVESTPMLA